MCTGVKPPDDSNNKESQGTNSSQYINPVSHSERIGTKVNPHEEYHAKTQRQSRT